MTVLDRFEQLALAGWRFWLDGDQVRFRAPATGFDEGLIDELRAHRGALREALRADPDRLEIAPLSHGQRALWLTEQLTPGSCAYNQSLLLRPGPEAGPQSWYRACQRLSARHAMLRARFELRGGEPVQRFASAPALDWAEAGGGADPAPLLQRMQAEPFDLAQGPPARFRWVSSPSGPLLVVLIHHIACDAWSFGLIARELRALAGSGDGAAAGRECSPAPASDYRDFVHWQRAMLAGERGRRLWAFWQDYLAPPRVPLELPADHPRGAADTRRNAVAERTLEPDAAEALRAFAAAKGLTPTALFAGGFLALLHRWTGGRDLMIGMPTSGRERPEWQQVVGYFVDPVVVRAQADPELGFGAFLAHVRDRVLAALEHRDLPFAQLVEHLGVARVPGRSPLFEVLFNHLRVPGGAPLPEEIPSAEAKFELTLTVFEGDERIRLAFGYRADLFEARTIDGLLQALATLLAAGCKEPERPLGRLPLVGGDSPAEPVLRGRRRDLADLPQVQETIRAWAQRRPGRLALVDGPERERTLTYAELVQEVERVAARLRAAGCEPGARVGLGIERSAEFVIALLAVLSLDAAYVPLDPEFPPPLLDEMLAAAGAGLFLTTAAAVPRFAGLRLPVLAFEGTGAAADALVQRGRPGAAPADLAYVVFTSGSSGRPKGVAVGHRALANYAASIREELGIEPGSRFAFVSTVAADLGNTAIFGALTGGGTLHVVPKATALDPAAFRAYLAAGVDYLKIAPSHLAALLGPARVLPRRGLILGGEAASTAWVRRLAGGAGCRVFNHYGPSEATVGVLVHEVDPDAPSHGETLPLSRAVANTSIYLLDDARRPVPLSVPGVLVVSGASLAHGYVGDQAEAASGFMTLPWGERAYRTGDLARQRADGRLEILGRADRQLNVHGHRIEPAQVEAALLRHDGVRQALAAADRAGAGASRLLAWVVPEPAAAAPEFGDALRRSLTQCLPAHLIPAEIRCVERIAVTGNGKVDLEAMRARTGPAPRGRAARPPKDALEQRLAGLFAELLGVSQVGPEDDFFALGGHSLLAVRLAGRIQALFGRQLPLAVFLSHRSVEGLAEVLRGPAPAPGRPHELLVPLRAGGDGGTPVVLFPGAGGSLLYLDALAAALGGHPVWGAHGRRGEVAALAERYDREIARHVGDGPCVLIGHSFGALVAFELAHQRLGRGAPATLWVLDNPAPGSERSADYRQWEPADWYLHIGRRIAKLYGVELALSRPELAGRPPAEQQRVFAERLLDAGVFPADSAREQIDELVATYRDNVIAGARYRCPAEVRPVPIRIARAGERDAELDWAPGGGDALMGWGACTRQPPSLVEVPGTHITMLLPPQVARLAEHIRASLGS